MVRSKRHIENELDSQAFTFGAKLGRDLLRTRLERCIIQRETA
jgi:hypothetical protein